MKLLNQHGVNGATLFGVALALYALRNEVNFGENFGYWVFVIGFLVFLIFSISEFFNLKED